MGLALAKAALARGDMVTGTVRTAEAADRLSALAPERAIALQLDVTDLAALEAAIDAVPPIDVLVNNAGYSLEGVVEATSIAAIREQIETHVMAPITLARAVLPGMRARRSGHILNVSSLAVHTPAGGTSVYAAAKAAIETLSIGLAREVAPFGIRVTAVVPGAFRTRLGEARRSAGEQIPDYAEDDARRQARLAAMNGRQRGDPARAAAALLALVNADEPPLRFAIGADAIGGMLANAALLVAETERWSHIGSDTDFAGQA